MTVLHLPIRQTVRQDKRRATYRNRPIASVAQLGAKRPAPQQPSSRQAAYQLYLQGSAIDDTDPDAGLKFYAQAIELDPGIHIAHTNMGNCYHRTGDIVRAMQCYEQALAINPEQAEANYNRGYLLLEQGNPGEALPLFKRAIAADPEFADAHFNLALALERTGMHPAALPIQAAWRKYLAIAPSTETVWREVAKRHLA